jgi:1-deoxyxylulose-5-phosphate synthase
MQYVKLGRTGLDVSRVWLGTMSFGDGSWRPWTISGDDAEAVLRRALDLGINAFDTADVYSDGQSEEILGRGLRRLARRHEIVIATKLFFPVREGPNAWGLSRKRVFDAVDLSLSRLGVDYLDLYQIHRWDARTPIEETMSALHDLVRMGKVRYLGASSLYAWQLATAHHVAMQNGWTPFVSVQPQYHLLYREEERELLPYCLHAGIGVVPWSPLARGHLARPWSERARTARGQDADFDRYDYARAPATPQIVDAVGEVADRRRVPRSTIALAWLLAQPVVTAPIVGSTRPEHLDDAVTAVEFVLDPDEIALLSDPYEPQRIQGVDVADPHAQVAPKGVPRASGRRTLEER